MWKISHEAYPSHATSPDLCTCKSGSCGTSNTIQKALKPTETDWDGYSTELDNLINDVKPIPENYGGFVDKVHVASRRFIPRECRTNHIPSLSEESKSLYEEYKKQYANDPFDNGTRNALMNIMEEEKKRWEEVITSNNMSHNSRKAWKIIKNISNDPTSPIAPCLVSANQVAHKLHINSRGTMCNKPKRPVLSSTAEESMVYPFREKEYRSGIATLKNNKAAGIDCVLVEQLKNLRSKTHKWLFAMLNNCFTQNKIPTIWRPSKIILKPGKDFATPKSYRPISLLCHYAND